MSSYMSVFLSLRSLWDLHCIMLGPTGEPQASSLGSMGLGEVHNAIYLVPTSWPTGIRPQASFSAALLGHFNVQVFSGAWGGGVLGPLP